MALLKQNNTIDIATARVGRLDLNPDKQPPALSLADLQRNLTLRLQTSLEVDRLMTLFFNEVRNLIPLCALSYRHTGTDFELHLGDAGGFGTSHPLIHQGDCLGELSLFSGNCFSELTMDQLESAIDCLLFPLCNALLYRRAVQASLKDPLTGVGNRVALEQNLSREIDISRRHDQPLSVIMLDMDHFKSLNDTHGHHAGDAVLRAVALLLKEQLRNVDMVFRFGGEEFVLVLSNTGPEAATTVGERIRFAIENLPFLVGEKQVRLSASLGCATYQQCESSEDLLRRADQALYEAKRDGRNRMRTA
jgi:diguanylate cyclase (GGDEF)-like protein